MTKNELVHAEKIIDGISVFERVFAKAAALDEKKAGYLLSMLGDLEYFTKAEEKLIDECVEQEERRFLDFCTVDEPAPDENGADE